MSVVRRTAAACGIAVLAASALVREGAVGDRLAFAALVTLTLATLAGLVEVQLRGGIRFTSGTPPTRDSRLAWFVVVIILATVTGLALQTWFRPGTLIATGDITPPIGTAWIERVFEPWLWTGSNLGEPSQLSQDLPWAAFSGAVHLLGGGAETAQRGWYTLLYVGAALSAAGLIASLGMRPLAGLVGAILYVFNPYVVSVVNTYPAYVIALGLLAGIPAVLIAVGTRRWSMRRGALVMAVCAPLLGTVFFNPPLVGMVLGASVTAPLLIGWTSGREVGVRTLKTTCVLLFLLAALSAYWIVPAIVHLSGGTAPQLAAISSWAWTETRATLRNAFWLNSLWGWRYPEYFPYAPAYDTIPVAVARFVLPAVAFGALALSKASADRRQIHLRDNALRLALVSSAVALFVIFLSTGTRPPGNILFDRLYELPFGWLLREPGRFLMIAALAYAVLVAVVTQTIPPYQPLFQLLRVHCDYRSVIGVMYVPAVFAACVLAGFPLLTGVVVPDQRPALPPAHVRVPGYWPAMAQYIDSLSVQGGVLVMPPDDFYQMSYKWGYYGNDDFIGEMLRRRVLLPNGQGYFATSTELASAVDLTTQSILEGNWPQTEALLSALNTPLILVRRDINPNVAGRRIPPGEDLSKALIASSSFLLVRQIGSLDLFALGSRASETETNVPMATINTRTPDLRLLPHLPVGSYLVSGEPRAGVPSVTQAPPLEQWSAAGDNLEWSPSLPSASSNRLIDLATNIAIPISHGTVPGPSGTRVSYASDHRSNEISVTMSSRSAVTNGDFAQGLWGPVGDCFSADPIGARLDGRLVPNGAPGGLVALRLGASHDSACETQRLSWRGGALIVSLQVRHVDGSAPRLCLWEAVRDRCAPLPNLPSSPTWTWYRAAVMPDAGTTTINLYLYADGDGSRRTINEYANVSVNEVASLPSLALLSYPQRPANPSAKLVVVHSTYSEAWQAPAGSHVLVDGMLNGWLLVSGPADFAARYEPRTLVQAGQWASVVTAVAIVAGGIWSLVLRLSWFRSFLRRRLGAAANAARIGK